MAETYIKFVEELSKDLNKSSDLQFSIGRDKVPDCEIEGECISLVLELLAKRSCPELLAAYLTRAVVNELLTRRIDVKCDTNQSKSTSDPSHQSNHTSDSKGLEGNEEDAKFSGMEADSFYRLVTDSLMSVCSKWNVPNSMLSSSNSCLVSSVHAIKNTRRKMEDKHVLLPYYSQLFDQEVGGASYYAVFDGHGGLDAARYASVQLHCQLSWSLRQHQNDVSKALTESFLNTDKMFSVCAKRQRYGSGSTALCSLITTRHIHVAWLGDSQAVLVRDGLPVSIMNPHKPEREDERKRIEALGGCVVWFGAWRVNGNLSVSRAIGDINYKPYVSGDADVVCLERSDSDDYLVLACDGLWDVLSLNDVTREVYAHLSSPGGDQKTVAQHLVRCAKERGSSDNITVVVVFLRAEISASRVPPESDEEMSEEEQEVDENGGKSGERAASAGAGQQSGSSAGTPQVGSQHGGSQQGGSKQSGSQQFGVQQRVSQQDGSSGGAQPGGSSAGEQKLGRSATDEVEGVEAKLMCLSDIRQGLLEVEGGGREGGSGHISPGVDSLDLSDSITQRRLGCRLSADRSGCNISRDSDRFLRRASEDSQRNVLSTSDEEWFGTAGLHVGLTPPLITPSECGYRKSAARAISDSPQYATIGARKSFSPGTSQNSPNSMVYVSSSGSPSMGGSGGSPSGFRGCRFKSPSLTAIHCDSSSTVESSPHVSKSLGSDLSLSSDGALSNSDLIPRARRVRATRGATKENIEPGQTSVTPPCKPSSSELKQGLPQQLASTTRLIGSASFRDSQRSLSQTSTQLLRSLGGVGARGALGRYSGGLAAMEGRQSLAQNRWTIAVEVKETDAEAFESSTNMAARVSSGNLASGKW